MSVANPVIASFDGTTRRIYLLQGVDAFHWIDDIYIEYRQERRLNEELRKFEPFMIASGNESKGQGKATPRLLKLLLGVKVIPYNEASRIYVTGEAITDDADVDATLFDMSTITFPVIVNYAPPAAEVIVVDAISNALDYGGILHYDENNTLDGRGVGQDHPVGTSANPVNNIADGTVIAAKFYLKEIETVSDVNMTRDMLGVELHGRIPGLTLYSHGFKAHLCLAKQLRISGDFNNSLVRIIDCNIIEALNIYGTIKDSFHSGRILIAAGSNLNMADCESGIPGLDSPEVDMNEGNDTTFGSRNFSGGQTITNCDTPNCVATLSFADGGKPHLEPSNTDGLLSVRGIGHMDDRSGVGCEVEDSAFFDPTDIAIIKKALGNNVTKNGDIITILEDDGVTVWKQYNLANGERILV